MSFWESIVEFLNSIFKREIQKPDPIPPGPDPIPVPPVPEKTYRPVWCVSDNIDNKKTDLERMQNIKNTLMGKGVECNVFASIGPSAHYTVYDESTLPPNAVILQIAGGSDAGVINEMAGNWFKKLNQPDRKVMIAIVNPDAPDLQGLDWLERAHDDDYDPESFTGVANPYQMLIDNGYGYIYSEDTSSIANSVAQFSVLAQSETLASDLNNMDKDAKTSIVKSDFLLMIDAVSKFNGTPLFVYMRINGVKQPTFVSWDKYQEMKGRWDAFTTTNGENPNYVCINKPCDAPVTPSYSTDVSSSIQKRIQDDTGKTFSNFTEFYDIVLKYCTYGYYFDDQKTLNQEIQSVINSINGIDESDNCVDYAQVGTALAKEMGYEAVVMGIYCPGDQINHAIFKIKGEEFDDWTIIDLAAASSDQYPIGSHWCSGAMTENPGWIPYE